MDYAALLALVALALAGAGAVTGLDAVPRRVVAAFRTALCIVGGDVCRPVDAAADGLAPCLTGERRRGSGFAVTALIFHLGHRGSWTVAQRSDGSVLVTRFADDVAGLMGNLGIGLGPAVWVGASGSDDVTISRGSAWELPSAAAAARFLAAVRRGEDPPLAPTWRFGALGDDLSASLSGTVAGVNLTAVEGSAGAAAGVRVGRGERTVYATVHADAASPFFSLPSSPGTTSDAADGGDGGPLVIGLTRDAHGLRELSFERATPGPRPGEVVETVGRLDLRVPANRAAVAPLLSTRLPWPPRVADGLRAAVRRTVQAGTIERSVYAVTDRSRDHSAWLGVGLQLGVDESEVDVQRRLVAASAWTHGSAERRRVDCLPEEAT